MEKNPKPSLSRSWKVFIWSLAIYLVVLTWGFLRLANYFLWLHFDCFDTENGCHQGVEALLKTTPGALVFWWLVGVGVLLLFTNIVVGVLELRKEAAKDQA